MTKIQFRRDTAAAWTSINPILSSGEIGFETDTLKYKLGNGSTAWNSLAYVVGAKGDKGDPGDTGAPGAQGPVGPSTVADNVLTIQNASDTTKQLKFSAASISTGTTRTLTAPNVSGTIAVRDASNNVSANNFIPSLTSTAGTGTANPITLTAASSPIQVVTTGSDGQYFYLPSTGVTAGMSFKFYSTNPFSVRVYSSGGGVAAVLSNGTACTLTALADTPTATNQWLNQTEFVGNTANSATISTAANAPAYATAIAPFSGTSINLLGFGLVNILKLNAPSTTVAAANYLQVNSALAGVTPSLEATGSDTNVSLNLITKGSGTVQVNSNPVGVKVNVPANATAAGVPGQWAADANYVYICTASNTWKRTSITSW